MWFVRLALVLLLPLGAAAQSYTLTVAKAGGGAGTVTSSPPGINCGATCSVTYSSGSAIVLTATPDGNSFFSNWSGACSGSGCTVTMDADKTAIANFAPKAATTVTMVSSANPQVALRGVTVSATVNGGSPTGTVTFIVDGAGVCNNVPLNGSHQAGCNFARVGGTYEVTAVYSGDQEHLASGASYNQVMQPSHLLSVVKDVSPTLPTIGTVSSSPAGINCLTTGSPSCQNYFVRGNDVTLTASNGNPNFVFGGWSLTSCGMATSCTVTLNSPVSVRAYFRQATGSATVPVISSSANPSLHGQAVTFTARIVQGAGAEAGSTMTFRNGPTGADPAICTAVPIVANEAQCTISSLLVGDRPIRVEYNYSGGTQGHSLTQVVGYTLNIARAGTGSGIVQSQSRVIDCGSVCSAFVTGPEQLTAAPGPGTTFSGWSGGGCSGTGTCTPSTTTSPLTVTAAFNASGLYASAGSIDFGGQSMGTTSPARTIAMINNGTSPATISSVSTTGPFSQTNNCGTVPAGSSCAINVFFTPPVAAGALNSQVPATGTLTVTSNTAGSPFQIALAGVGEKSLVTHYYQAILRRAPDSGGQAFWASEASRMQGLGANVNETWFAMAMQFYGSAEYLGLNRDSNGYVTDLYNTFFNRPPDSGGLAFWVGQMNSGLPREAVLLNFLFSAEFVNFTQAIFGSTAARAEVDMVMDFYRGILGRLPDSGGFTFYRDRFRAAQCASAAAVYSEVETISSAFINSAEYNGRGRNNTQFVTDLYNAFTRRGPDTGGVSFWVGQLDSGQSREYVRVAFRDSPEFSQRVNRVLAESCIPP